MAGIPHYYLYGEPGAGVDRDLLHIEPVRDRSGPNDWRIRPHAHPDHMQVMLVADGGGTIRMEDRALAVPSPGLLVIPAGIVHQIDFDPGTDGHVITAALPCLAAAGAQDPALGRAAGQAAAYPLDGSGVDVAAAIEAFRSLQREFLWAAPGRRAAIIAQFSRILVLILRLSLIHRAPAIGAADHDLLVRYRALVEAQFRSHHPPAHYAALLAVTPARLNAACKARAGRTASDILHDRLVVEAKRYLIYTESSVAQVAHLTGFDDPAYFNRFFTRRVGCAPGAFRRQAAES